MKNPQYIILTGESPTLEGIFNKKQIVWTANKGIKQYFYKIPLKDTSYKIFNAKVEKILQLFSKISFHQCLIFSNDRGRLNNYY